MKKVLVTGVNGLLGTNLTQDLLQNGFYVRGLLRSISAYAGADHSHLELVEGKLLDDLTEILEGMDVVIHAAAETRQNRIRYSDYLTVNCDGTLNLLKTAIKCGVKKFVFISTANTLGYGTVRAPGNESMSIKYPFTHSFYARSKLEAEDALLKHLDRIDVVIMNPTFMLGAYDTRPGSGRIILMGLKKKVVFYPPGGKNFVHVKEVSQSVIQSITKGKRGEKYLIANENLSYREFFEKLRDITHASTLLVKIPKPVLLAIGYMGDILRRCGVKTSFSSANMKILCINNFYSNDKSKLDLQTSYHSIDQAILDAVTYFQRVSGEDASKKHS